MKPEYLTDAEVNALGWRALVEKLGPATALRFMVQHERGQGDYVRWRQDHLAKLTVSDWVSLIEQRRSRSGAKTRRKKR